MKQKIDVTNLWRFLSSFFNSLDDRSKAIWEFFWEGITFAANDMIKAAARFLYSSAPERSYVYPTIDYYPIKIDITQARPIQLDSTDYSSGSVLISRSIITSNPVGSGRESVRNDMIEIGKKDYGAIRDIAIGQYLVIDANNAKLPIKYFKVLNLKSPEETGSRLYDKYVIELENCNLSYIPVGSKTTVYLTTGKVYKVDDYVIDLPSLYVDIANLNEDGSSGVLFHKDTDYSFSDHYVEFTYDIVALGKVRNGDSLYGKDVSVMEYNLYNSFGGLVNVPNWSLYNHDNIGGKVAINSLVKSLQNSSNKLDYERALNVYYGLPIAPEDSEVLGLFESYDYEVTSVNSTTRWISVSMNRESTLHKFIQPGTKLIIDGSETIVNVDYDAVESNVINRVNGWMKINNVDDIVIGTKLNIKLVNKMRLVSVEKPASASSILTVSYHTDGAELQHVTNYDWTNFSAYPELLVYGSESTLYNYNGYFHFRSCGSTAPGYVRLTVDDYVLDTEEPRYNDYIDLVSGDPAQSVTVGYVHIPWPTHKYLLLKFTDGTLYKAFLDSPIDTIYDTGDQVTRYQALSRCISVMNEDTFENWNEFIKKSNGIDLNSKMLEMVYTIANTKYGIYMPN